jgi:hypothetical protein
MKHIILNPEDYLVEELPNYFKSKESGKISMDAAEFVDFKVGVIRKSGDDVDCYDGKIIYFKEGMSVPHITIKGEGNFFLVPNRAKLIIRTDQSESNY